MHITAQLGLASNPLPALVEALCLSNLLPLDNSFANGPSAFQMPSAVWLGLYCRGNTDATWVRNLLLVFTAGRYERDELELMTEPPADSEVLFAMHRPAVSLNLDYCVRVDRPSPRKLPSCNAHGDRRRECVACRGESQSSLHSFARRAAELRRRICDPGRAPWG